MTGPLAPVILSTGAIGGAAYLICSKLTDELGSDEKTDVEDLTADEMDRHMEDPKEKDDGQD